MYFCLKVTLVRPLNVQFCKTLYNILCKIIKTGFIFIFKKKNDFGLEIPYILFFFVNVNVHLHFKTINITVVDNYLYRRIKVISPKTKANTSRNKATV